MLDTNQIKKYFPVFKNNPNLVYLDSAASSQTPECVLDAMNGYYRGYRANIHRSLYPMGERATDAHEQARSIVARFIGASEKEVVFTSGSTESMNMLVYSLEQYLSPKKGDEIVATVTEHHSALIPLQQLAKRHDLALKHIELGEDFELNYEQAQELITPQTKIVSVSLASNVLGTINDVKKIAEIAHHVGALVICDATKAAGHMPIDVRELGCDFLIFSGHKMCGPTGIGVLYGKAELLDVLPPSMFGGGIVEGVNLVSAVWTSAPTKFEAGTPNIAGAIGLGAAMLFLEDIGVENIHQHVEEVTSYAFARLREIPGVSVFSQKDPRKNAGIASFTVDGVHPHDVAEIAARAGVAIRAGHHCAQPLMNVLGVVATLRASFYLYNDKDDVDALVEAIKKAQEIFKK